jgi:hypothetical protein
MLGCWHFFKENATTLLDGYRQYRQPDSKTYQIEFFNLEVIISVGPG